MNWLKNIFTVAIAASIFTACDDKTTALKETDTPTSGTMNISVDETYQPVMEEELKVFSSTYPDAHITINYKSEAAAIKDFMEGKTKFIIVSRELSEAENEYCLSHSVVPSSLALAKDAVAVILNKDAKDTAFSTEQLQAIVAGTFSKKYTVVFDNEGSSTLRFITDSIMGKTPLGKNLYAAKGNQQVIDYVMKNPEAIGFVGLSFVSDTMDSTAERFTTQLKIASIYNDSLQAFYQPYQANIALKQYPLARKMFYIKNETYQGLASGFANFLAYDKGQLILGHARLVPLRMSIVIRDAAVNTEEQ